MRNGQTSAQDCWLFVILLVCLNMARVPGKHCRLHYLAIWTASPNYIFSHYSSILYLQSKGESPNQRMAVACGIIMTHECNSSLGCENRGILVYAPASCFSAILSAASQSCIMPLDFIPACNLWFALERKANFCSFLLLLFHWVSWLLSFLIFLDHSVQLALFQ